MQKKICFVLTLTVIHIAESLPVKLGTLEFDNLDANLSELGYEVEEEDLDHFSELFNEPEVTSKPTSVNSKDNVKSKLNVNTSGFKKKNTEKKGVQSKHNIGDIKKFFKGLGAHDQGSYDDADLYALAQGVAAAASRSEDNASRNYRKGTKTRGFHRVHHKDEYKKDQEFYEDDEVNGNIKKVGAKAIGVKLGAAADFNKGYFNHDRHKGIHGNRGYLDKGYSDADIYGYSDSQGFDGSFTNSS